MIRVGVIGYGYWGPNIVRNFMEVEGATVVVVSDVRSERLNQVRARYPSVRTTTDPGELFTDSEIDAIIVVTPISTHFELALQALRADKHVLVEKPLAATSEQGLSLIEEAQRRDRVLMVDHTFVYTGAVRKIREIVASNTLGDIYYYDSVRVNLGLFQPDVNVIWDLAVHDLSIMDYVLPIKPVAVSATGISHIPGKRENVAYMTLFFPNSQIAHLHVNWLAPVKVRRTLIGGSERMIVYDDLEPSEKVKVYDRGVTLFPQSEAAYELLVSYRSGDMRAPRLEATEGLRTAALHFIDCIENSVRPETDGQAGLRIVRIVEAAEKSLRNRGQLEEIVN
ncbi:MAG: Gfo/Idh/MocA family protein [Pyrinomonadaceae bacterium]